MASSSPLSVLVLAGGISHEREISLRSGRIVADALRARDVRISVADPDARLLTVIEESAPDVIWPVLHGASGEDGALRSLLELMGVAFVGADSAATRLAWDKPAAKTLVERSGLHTPESLTLSRDAFRELGAESVMNSVAQHLSFPLIVKPTRGGSAQGVSWVANGDDLRKALVHAFTYGDVALIERHIHGTEVAVTVIDTGDGPRALPPVEIAPVSGRYTFEARYNAGETDFYCPPRKITAVLDRVTQDALQIHTTLGLRDLSRIDLIVDDHGIPWFLEASVMPGLTETSAFGVAVDQAGFDAGGIFLALAESVSRRH